MSDPAQTDRQRLDINDALAFLEAVKKQFEDCPQFYDRFLDAMSDFKAQRTDVLGAIEAVIDLLHPFPDLLLAWNTFLPDVYHVHSTPDPKDPYTSFVTVKTPNGELRLWKRVANDMYPLIPVKEEMAPILVLLQDIEAHYAQRPEVYKRLIKTIQPRPDNPIDKYQMINEIEAVISDSPHLLERFKKILDV